MAKLQKLGEIHNTDGIAVSWDQEGLSIYDLRRHFACFCENQLGVVAHPGDIFCSMYYTFLDAQTRAALGIQTGQNASSFMMTNLAQVKVYIDFIRRDVQAEPVATDGDTLRNYSWGKVFHSKREALAAIDLFADFCEEELRGWLRSEES